MSKTSLDGWVPCTKLTVAFEAKKPSQDQEPSPAN
jgi:hypothetical protein